MKGICHTQAMLAVYAALLLASCGGGKSGELGEVAVMDASGSDIARALDVGLPDTPTTTGEDAPGDTPGEIDLSTQDTADAADGCLPGCQGMECGDDGCGGSCGKCDDAGICANGLCTEYDGTCNDQNSVDWDGCTNGQITEFCLEPPECPHCSMHHPQVSVLPDRRFMVSWTTSYPSDETETWIAVFKPDGKGIESLFKVGESQSVGLRLQGLSDSSIAAIWLEQIGLVARRLSPNGNPVSGPVLLYEANGIVPLNAALTALDDNVVATWVTVDSPEVGTVNMVLSGAFPTVLPEPGSFDVPIGGSVGICGPEPALVPGGTAVVVGSYRAQEEEEAYPTRNVFLQHVSDEGMPLSPMLALNTFQLGDEWCPSVSCPIADHCIVAWMSEPVSSGNTCRFPDDPSCNARDGDSTGVFATTLNPHAPVLVPEFQVNSYTEGGQNFPSVVSWSSGESLIVWSHAGTLNTSINFARFDMADTKLAVDEQVNANSVGTVNFPDAAAFKDGGWIVTWTLVEPTLPGRVCFQRFDSLARRRYR